MPSDERERAMTPDQPEHTEQAKAFATRFGLTTDGFCGPVCIACGQDSPGHGADCPLAAALTAAYAVGDREGYQRGRVAGLHRAATYLASRRTYETDRLAQLFEREAEALSREAGQ